MLFRSCGFDFCQIASIMILNFLNRKTLCCNLEDWIMITQFSLFYIILAFFWFSGGNSTMSHKKRGLDVFGFPLQELEFCKEIKIFYCYLYSLLSVRVSVFDVILIIFFVCVFVSVHHQAQEMKASWVSRLHFSVIFLFCFREAIFFLTFLILFPLCLFMWVCFKFWN